MKKVNIWDQEQLLNVFEKFGYGTNMGKYIFQNLSMGIGTKVEEMWYNNQNSHS